MVAPLLPHDVHRAHWRSLSLEVSGPQRITATAQATDAGTSRNEPITTALNVVARLALAVEGFARCSLGHDSTTVR
jgi:hypothetical protein